MHEIYIRAVCFLLGPDTPVPFCGHRRDLRCKRCRGRLWFYSGAIMHVNERGYHPTYG